MKVLVTGAGGQVGRCLIATAPPVHTVDAQTHSQFDVAKRDLVAAYLRSTRPEVVINTAAYTAVDRAETETVQARAINELGVKALAETCRDHGSRLIHISTDYVFDGRSISAYEPDAATNPLNAYGASKLAGERHIAGTANLNWTIVRTSWVYAPRGQNFVLTMLRLMRERGAVSVVCDQLGTPTSALSLARFLWRVVQTPEFAGIAHYTDNGVASWYDFAVAINEEALACGLLQKPAAVRSIPTSAYPTAAKRPAMSVLATDSTLRRLSFTQPHWREALREVLQEVRNQS